MDELKKKGVLIETQGNSPFLVNDPDYVWIIKEKTLNLYTVYLKDKKVFNVRNYACTMKEGDVIWGHKADETFGFLGVGERGTKILKVKISDLKEDLPFYLEKWIEIYTKFLVKTLSPPTKFRILEEDIDIEAEKGEYALSLDRVLWLKHIEGKSSFIGRDDLPSLGNDCFFPVSRHIWLKANDKIRLKGLTTEKYLQEEPDCESLKKFHNFTADFIKIRLAEKFIEEKEYLEKKETGDSELFNNALSTIAGVMEKENIIPEEATGKDPVFLACLIIGKAQGINFTEPNLSEKEKKLESPLNAIARGAGARTRKVILQGQWWKKDSGPILAFIEKTKNPVALIPSAAGGYKILDPLENTEKKVTKERASYISPEAFIFYKPFPPIILNLKNLLQFELKNCRKDFLSFITAGIMAGILGMFVPVATGIIFDAIIPGAEINQLTELAIALLVCSVSVVMFQLTQAIALLRIEGKMKGTLQAAMWDRILALPCSFFRQFSSGDLAMRALGINLISNQLFTGLLLPSILGLIYAVFNFILLFYYDISLALIGSAFAFSIFIATGLTAYFQLSYQQELSELQGKISGFVFQIINGISKITISGSQSRIFAKWAEKFSLQKKYSFKAGLINIYMSIFNSIFPIASGIVIFSFMALQLNSSYVSDNISTGNFLAFNAAFTSFTMALIQLGTTLAALTNMVPVYRRMKPILETLPEIDVKKPEPGDLKGEIEVKHLGFRYNKEGKKILHNVSFDINPGEFVAFVGPSGAGKSTILRLLLGFETPEEGSIYYDGRDLKEIDLAAVRRQIGVVLQNNKLMAGPIYYNIIGSSLLTIDDAWEAARLAGIYDDIKAMPMGMHTFVSEGAGTFSGGQKQRLLIARALARKPRIILFDEATSALDNRTQNIVTESLSRLNSTRIVIAHRLSTVIDADKIYVMDKGRIVQTGTYEELMKEDGPFKELAKRQVL